MKIGILSLHKTNVEKEKFYNLQDIGLAYALSKNHNELLVYRSISRAEFKLLERHVEYYGGVTIEYIPTISFGNHTLFNPKKLDKTIENLICFSDNQVFFPIIYSWCLKNKIRCLPYIGSVQSKSKNIIKQKAMLFLSFINTLIYRRIGCFAKTPYISNILKKKGVKFSQVLPVGLDTSKLNINIDQEELEILKNSLKIQQNEKVVLMVGRLISSKHPIELVNLIKNVILKGNKIKFIIIGKGPLESELLKKIEDENLSRNILYIKEVPNADMWKYYSISDFFINWCSDEIFGMAILEAMFYENVVIALDAPGPSYIIKDTQTGFIRNNYDEISKIICSTNKYDEIKKMAKNSIINEFTWEVTSKKFLDFLKR